MRAAQVSCSTSPTSTLAWGFPESEGFCITWDYIETPRQNVPWGQYPVGVSGWNTKTLRLKLPDADRSQRNPKGSLNHPPPFLPLSSGSLKLPKPAQPQETLKLSTTHLPLPPPTPYNPVPKDRTCIWVKTVDLSIFRNRKPPETSGTKGRAPQPTSPPTPDSRRPSRWRPDLFANQGGFR